MMWLLRVLAATVVLGLPIIHAEPIVDLTASHKDNTPSLLDLSGGNPANWETNTDSAYVPMAGGSGGYSESRFKTQHVSGYTRNDGTNVRSYSRASRR
jgi:hypothetical protein